MHGLRSWNSMNSDPLHGEEVAVTAGDINTFERGVSLRRHPSAASFGG